MQINEPLDISSEVARTLVASLMTLKETTCVLDCVLLA